ncbi:MAG TPA: Na+/H+ antiporter subunit D [Bryobacteraceae bacterium]|nr:Na+/H+ antiporter subunit D [Bryobacteraceae bacterium]HOQ46973.1 Na+/H+ antiporter subunit D [Bryobacteraceae bacterium]HPQ14986.1 Na+/H+ antiporter subunit D [Bryobacteraceae bacterium]HPU73100.1 Na+/H+ antiporter subunit D [Bryobacteraceae bacterium]
MGVLLTLPILIPLFTAALCLLAWRWWRVQRVLGLVSAFALLCAAAALLYRVRTEGIQAVQIGAWPAPYGISLVADLFSAMMVMITGILGAAVAVYSAGSLDKARQSFGYYPLYHVLLMGVCGAFLTGDIFNLYVWFEVMLMASFVLLALGGGQGQIEGALKYVTLNLMASSVFLAAVGLLYSVAGTLNMADLARKLRHAPEPGIVTVLAMLFLVAFGTKAATFPLFFWLPASYHTPPVAVSAIFAGLLTKVGVYALIRVFTLIFVRDDVYVHTLILVIAGLTMVTGVLGAIAQNEFRRLLSFHIVSQIGYMIMGLALFTPLGLAGSVLFIIHNILAKSNLFLVSGLAQRFGGTFDLKKLGGLYEEHPALAVLFLVPALSLAGLPPFVGFFAKLLLIKAGLEAGSYVIVAVALGVSLLTLFSMMKIWTEVFWKPAPQRHPAVRRRAGAGLWASTASLAALTLALGIAAGPAFDLSRDAAAQLVNPQSYIDAVSRAHR